MTDWRGYLVLLAGLSAAGCPDENSRPCDAPVMAFRVTLTAADGPLPPGMELIVDHGTGEAKYHPGDPPSSQVLFCENRLADGGPVDPDAGVYPALVCELWTDGAAHVTVRAEGYLTLDEQLDAKLESGCLKTRDVQLTLERGDAGT